MWKFKNIQDIKNTEVNAQSQLVLLMKQEKTNQQNIIKNKVLHEQFQVGFWTESNLIFAYSWEVVVPIVKKNSSSHSHVLYSFT